ncbi:hypothetical protein ACIRPQ_15640 [Streptomyces sp. NPDC101213]|uniref:hypothetical protein n=1 Tax=Streptomyces sp. NPDC101213 TaxID=3366130 RepID=UPI0038062618
MLWIAVLLLPSLSVLLAVMDRMEDRVLAPARPRRRHAGHRRHLHLVRDTSRSTGTTVRKGAHQAAGETAAGPRAA